VGRCAGVTEGGSERAQDEHQETGTHRAGYTTLQIPLLLSPFLHSFPLFPPPPPPPPTPKPPPPIRRGKKRKKRKQKKKKTLQTKNIKKKKKKRK